MKLGYIYVLVHPSSSKLYKIGVTTRNPETRLAEHNSDYTQYTGQIVKETGHVWLLKEFHEVVDPTWAEACFWASTGLDVIPYRSGIEIEELDWKTVQKGIEVAKTAGIRPQKPVADYIYAYNAWMNKRLEGRHITLLGDIRSKHGKANFSCSNGHSWRTVPNLVAEGAGCPECGMDTKDIQDIEQSIRPGSLCLLTHPDYLGMIKIEIQYINCNDPSNILENSEGWIVHRFRYTEECELALKVIWRLLECNAEHSEKPFKFDLQEAEDAFRRFTYEMHREAVFQKDGGY